MTSSNSASTTSWVRSTRLPGPKAHSPPSPGSAVSSTADLPVAMQRAATEPGGITVVPNLASPTAIFGEYMSLDGTHPGNKAHVLITNLAMWYPRDQVEFYLVDFKKGVEFKTYATHLLPHALGFPLVAEPALDLVRQGFWEHLDHGVYGTAGVPVTWMESKG